MNLRQGVKNLLLSCFLILFFTAFGKIEKDGPVSEKQKMILQMTMRNIENNHIKPKTINDDFSVAIWGKHLKGLDPNFNILFQKDMDDLETYRLNVDDEIKAGSLDFFNASFAIYKMRMEEVVAFSKLFFSNPVAFNKKETLEVYSTHPRSEKERQDRWRKRLKFYVLKKYVDIKDAKLILNPKTLLTPQLEAEMEKEARLKIGKWIGRLFDNLLKDKAVNDKFDSFMNIITMEIDPHTNYFAPDQTRARQEDITKRYFGLGIGLYEKEGDIYIKSVMPGGAAFLSGRLEPEDCLLQIEDDKGVMIEVTGLPLTDIALLIRGVEGSSVRLLLRKKNQIQETITLKRTEIKEKAGTARSVVIEENGKKIGYIFLPTFYDDANNPNGAHAAVDVIKELKKLNEQLVSGVIMDLRNNPGGSMSEVVNMAGAFLGKGPKVLVKGRNGIEIKQTDIDAVYKGPLAVMINEASASASEIFSAVIQDYNRGIIIGSTTSYGKGTAQQGFPIGKLGDEQKGIPNLILGSLVLTNYQFYRVNGETTQLNGVRSDIIMPSPIRYSIKKESDFQTALPSDQVSATQFSSFPSVSSTLKKKVQEDVNASERFKRIGKYTKNISELEKIPVRLDVKGYEERMKLTKQYIADLENALSLSPERKLTVHDLIDLSDRSEEWYKDWKEKVMTDVYIAETLRILRTISE